MHQTEIFSTSGPQQQQLQLYASSAGDDADRRKRGIKSADEYMLRDA